MWNRFRASLIGLVAAAALVGPACASAETVALIGTGNVGAALGRRFAEHGHKIVYGSRNPAAADVRGRSLPSRGHGAVAVTQAEAAAQADIVILAVPWSAAEDVVRALPSLRGKVVVDPTNPRVQASDGFADYPPPLEDSNAERIAASRPARRSSKRSARLASGHARSQGRRGPRHRAARRRRPRGKARVAVLAREIGLEAIDVGPLRPARIIEGLHYLRANAAGGRINYHFPRDTSRD